MEDNAMNERIKELWHQSKTSGTHPEFGEYDKYSIETFAELIVRECASKVTRNEALNILEHFGVEE
jgi:hypothetical protein